MILQIDNPTPQFTPPTYLGSQKLESETVAASHDHNKLRLSLAGPLRVRSGDREIKVSSIMTKKLLAILARSEGMCRSRSVLQVLLWDQTTSDPASSLRQLLVQTRSRLGTFGRHLVADATTVSLVGAVDETDSQISARCAFFEDAGFGTEEFEEWLRFERTAFQDSDHSAPSTSVREEGNSCPVVGLTIGSQICLDSRQAVVAEWVSNLFRDVLVWNDFVECRDFRHSSKPVDCDLEIRVSVLPLGSTFDISTAVVDVETGRHVWSRSMQVPSGKELSQQRNSIQEFAQITASGIENLLPSLANRLGERAKRRPQLHDIVSKLFTMRASEVRWAVNMLDEFDETENLATVLAWQGFGNMLMNGEQLVSDKGKALEEAERLIQTAFDLDQLNPTALAVASHYSAFVRRDLDLARELSDQALNLVPYSPFARDVRATLELYDDNLGAAIEHARVAQRLGQSGPLRHYISATSVMISTLMGDHERAVRLGQHLLAQRPRFLPVMRHLSASLAESGHLQEAQEMVSRLRQIDGDFATAEMDKEHYPLPSAQSRHVIRTILKQYELGE